MPVTEQRAPLDKRLEHLALTLQEMAHNPDANERHLREFLRDEAYSLSEFALQVREEYARLSDKGSGAAVATNAQGVALAARFTERTLSLHVTRGSCGLPDDYLYVIARADRSDVPDFHFGVDSEGRVSS